MTQPIRKKKRLWTNVLANGRREEKFRETVTVLPGGTEEYRDGWERIWGARERPDPPSMDDCTLPEGHEVEHK